ncbi:MAG: Hsp20/alpha crystallin family protein [Pseudomonadota bacterium]
MSIITYEPWSLLNRVRHDLDRLATSNASPRNTNYDWVPAVDIAEHDERFSLSVDVPGVDPEAIEISAEDGVLTISGTRDKATAEADRGQRRLERRTGKFLRRFELPDNANADAITASSRLGVLEVSIPKQAKVEPRRINVSAA